MVQLNDWSVVRECADFQAPEAAKLCLKGIVRGHHRAPDGSTVITSPVNSATGRVITTLSGTKYNLGDPSPEYREWLRAHRPAWDPEKPFLMLERQPCDA